MLCFTAAPSWGRSTPVTAAKSFDGGVSMPTVPIHMWDLSQMLVGGFFFPVWRGYKRLIICSSLSVLSSRDEIIAYKCESGTVIVHAPDSPWLSDSRPSCDSSEEMQVKKTSAPNSPHVFVREDRSFSDAMLSSCQLSSFYNGAIKMMNRPLV